MIGRSVINALLLLILSFRLCSAILNYPNSDAPRPAKVRNTETILSEYHFIVIGAGSAGSVVANRLAEIPEWQVLLIESGIEENDQTDVPLFIGLSPEYDWKYKTAPQKYGFHAFENNATFYPRGRAIGGSSVINAMHYMRGDRKIYDNWASVSNNGWNYENVLKYFIKSENNMNFRNSKYHGINGSLTVQYPPYDNQIIYSFIEAGIGMGYAHTDLNGQNCSGFMKLQATMRDGKRCSTSKAFLESNCVTSNLHIIGNSHVTRILINTFNQTAYGVEFIRNNMTYKILARNEVILSAGAINSPQILMLSGIGPRAELNKHNIQLIKELNVGHNLQDHIMFVGLKFSINQTLSIQFDSLTKDDLYDYLVKHEGPMTSLRGFTATALITSKYAKANISDIQLFLANINYGGLEHQYGYNRGFQKEFATSYYKTLRTVKTDVFGILVAIVQPQSVGTVTLNSKSPFDAPIINPNYLTRQIDRNIMIDGIRQTLKLVERDAFKRYDTRLLENDYPACRNIEPYSDAYWNCYISQYCTTVYHPVATCKMGNNPALDVVDANLFVYGIRRLRVIDASIIPIIPNANTNAPTIMIGEKGADLIKTHWRKPV